MLKIEMMLTMISLTFRGHVVQVDLGSILVEVLPLDLGAVSTVAKQSKEAKVIFLFLSWLLNLQFVELVLHLFQFFYCLLVL